MPTTEKNVIVKEGKRTENREQKKAAEVAGEASGTVRGEKIVLPVLTPKKRDHCFRRAIL